MKWIYVFIGLIFFSVSGCVKQCDGTYDRSDIVISKTGNGIKIHNNYTLPVFVKTVIVYNASDSIIGGYVDSSGTKILSLFSHTYDWSDLNLTDTSANVKAATVFYERQYCDYGTDNVYDGKQVQF
ncbi:MAG TPA: hypothetical protein VGB95_02915 [Chitinophagales bacterium]